MHEHEANRKEGWVVASNQQSFGLHVWQEPFIFFLKTKQIDNVNVNNNERIVKYQEKGLLIHKFYFGWDERKKELIRFIIFFQNQETPMSVSFSFPYLLLLLFFNAKLRWYCNFIICLLTATEVSDTQVIINVALSHICCGLITFYWISLKYLGQLWLTCVLLCGRF